MLKIVLSGGPSSGKSSSLAILTQLLESRGYHVFTVFEAASSLILNGIKPSSYISMDDFQEFIIDMQLATEKIFDGVTKHCDSDKIIIFYDREIMDGAAYVERSEFAKLLKKKKLTINDVMSRYDAVFHLVTAADGAEEFYSWNDPTDYSRTLHTQSGGS